MVAVYGEDCVSDKSVRKWSGRFRAGRESLFDDSRSGQANTVITADLIDKVDDLVKSDRFNSDDELKDAVKDWISSRPQEFWEQGILRLVNQWDRCAQAYGVYFE